MNKRQKEVFKGSEVLKRFNQIETYYDPGVSIQIKRGVCAGNEASFKVMNDSQYFINKTNKNEVYKGYEVKKRTN